MLLTSWVWRVVVIAGAFIFMGLRLWARSKFASDHARGVAFDAMNQRRWSFELRNHPAWGQLWRYLGSQGVQAVYGPPQAGQFRIRALFLFNQHKQRVSPQDPSAGWLIAYLEGPKQLWASFQLSTGRMEWQECRFIEWPDLRAFEG